MMEGNGGASLLDLRVRAGTRQSVFRSYAFPYMDRPNLTVLTHVLVTRLTLAGTRATGVEMAYDDQIHRVGAGLEVVLSLGAIQTPKVLMQSGIGDEAALHRLGIPVVQHLSGVGQNFQDHVAVDTGRALARRKPRRFNGSDKACFGFSQSSYSIPMHPF